MDNTGEKEKDRGAALSLFPAGLILQVQGKRLEKAEEIVSFIELGESFLNH